MRQRCKIPLEDAEDPDDQQPAARIERLIRIKETDQILNFLVADDPPDKQDVRPVVVELAGNKPVCGIVEMRQVRYDRQHLCPWKSQRLEILTVEFRIAEGEIAAFDVGVNLAPAAEALARQRAMYGREVLGRRDVVVNERHPIR